MKRTNIYLTESQYTHLAALSDGRSVSEIIRRAIDEYISQHIAQTHAKQYIPRPPALSEAEKKTRAQARRHKARILRIREAQKEAGFSLQQTVDYFDENEKDNPALLALLDEMLEAGALK